MFAVKNITTPDITIIKKEYLIAVKYVSLILSYFLAP